MPLKSEKSDGGSPEIQNEPLGSKRDFYVWAGVTAKLASNSATTGIRINDFLIHDLRCATGSQTLNDL